MKIHALHLKDFRRFESAHIELEPGLNYFHGPNAAGKTTLLEALLLLATGRSMRTRHLDQLVRLGAERFGLSCRFERHGINQQIDLFSTGKRHELTINATRGHRLHALLGLCQGVVITPEDLHIVSGGPDERRRFIDGHLCITDPLYVHHLHRYKRALKQRAACLKQRSFATIGVWEAELAKAAAYITAKRAEGLEALTKEAAPLLQALSGGSEELSLSFKIPDQELETYYTKLFEKNREKEAILQTTIAGPHRDDIQIQINANAARSFASEGQKKSIVCALRLAQWHHMHEDEPPFLGIDDIGACFDAERLKALLEQIESLGAQVFVTAPIPTPIPTAAAFEVNEGKVSDTYHLQLN